MINNHLAQLSIDKTIINLFVEKIEIGHLEKDSSSKATQSITIHYRF